MPIASLPTRLALRLLFAFGFGFFLSMFTRSVANIMKGYIQTDLGLSEEMLSLTLGTSFFVAFGLMQLPLGVLLDRYDPRKINAVLFAIAGVGAVLFGLSDDATTLAIGRVLMGIGFAGGMMGAMKTYALWFPAEKLATLNGIQFAVGILGAISATKPTQLALEIMTWQELTLGFGVLTCAAAAIDWLVAPARQMDASTESLHEALNGIGKVYTDGFFWRVMPWVALTMGISQGIGTLYVFSWMVQVGGHSESMAATALSAIAAVAILNFLVMGPVAEQLGKRGWPPMRMPVIGVGLSMLAMTLLVAQITSISILIWLIWTVAIGTNVLSFAAIARAFPPALAGRALTALNMMGFAFTALSQWAVGVTLDLYPADIAQGYQVAFGLLLAAQALGGVWFWLATRWKIGAQTMAEKEASTTPSIDRKV